MTLYLRAIAKLLYQKVIDTYPWVFCFAVAYVTSFTLSGVYLPSLTLDHSYQVVLEHAVTHNLQFGKDIVFTFGPLGFLDTTVSQGMLQVPRMLFALVWSGIVAWSVTSLVFRIPGAMKYVFLVWFLFYSNPGVEQHAFLVITYGCMILIDDVQKRKSEILIFLILFALLALIKFTLFMSAVVCVMICSLVHIGKRNIGSFFSITLLFGVVLLAIWTAAGQRLENFFPWLRGSIEIAEGFTEAMTIFPKLSVLVICATVGALFLASLWLTFRSVRLSLSCAGILMVMTANVFLSWKHSFVRADGHVMDFIFLLPMAYAILFNEEFQKRMNKRSRSYLVAVFMGTIVLCNWAADIQEPGTMLTKLVDWPYRVVGNSRLILSLVSGNQDDCFEALRKQHSLKRAPDLFVARGVVGVASVDVVNYTQWAALANNMNYHPRPVIQGYSAYTPYLQDLNLSYYQSENHPEFLLFNMETIDERFPALDDATLLVYILTNYRPVSKDGDYLVLRSVRNKSINSILTRVHEQTLVFGKSLKMPSHTNSLLIMQVEIEPTFFGRIVKFLFQSPVLALDIKTNGKIASYRFVPTMAKRGFIVSPLLIKTNDVMHYYAGASTDRFDSIRFSRPNYAWGQLSNTIKVRFYELVSS